MATRARKTRTQGKGPRCARSCCLGDAPGRALRPVALAQRGGEVRGRRQRTPGAEHLREAGGAGTRRPPDPEWGGGGGGRERFVSAAGETGDDASDPGACQSRLVLCAPLVRSQMPLSAGRPMAAAGQGLPAAGAPWGDPGGGSRMAVTAAEGDVGGRRSLSTSSTR